VEIAEAAENPSALGTQCLCASVVQSEILSNHQRLGAVEPSKYPYKRKAGVGVSANVRNLSPDA
jgi:hypothetical protein